MKKRNITKRTCIMMASKIRNKCNNVQLTYVRFNTSLTYGFIALILNISETEKRNNVKKTVVINLKNLLLNNCLKIIF